MILGLVFWILTPRNWTGSFSDSPATISSWALRQYTSSLVCLLRGRNEGGSDDPVLVEVTKTYWLGLTLRMMNHTFIQLEPPIVFHFFIYTALHFLYNPHPFISLLSASFFHSILLILFGIYFSTRFPIQTAFSSHNFINFNVLLLCPHPRINLQIVNCARVWLSRRLQPISSSFNFNLLLKYNL